MKRFLSAAVASAMILSAAAPALAAGDFSKGARPAKIGVDMKAHGMMGHKKGAPSASHFSAAPGKKHFGMAMMTKKQAAHGFAANSIPNLKGKSKKMKP